MWNAWLLQLLASLAAPAVKRRNPVLRGTGSWKGVWWDFDQFWRVDQENETLPPVLSGRRGAESAASQLCSYGAALCHQAAHSLHTHLFAAVTPQMLSADDQLVVPRYDNSPSYLMNRLVHYRYWENHTRQERLLQVPSAEGKILVPL